MGVKGKPATIQPHIQFGVIPPPTTTDNPGTAQVAYIQICVDTDMSVEFSASHMVTEGQCPPSWDQDPTINTNRGLAIYNPLDLRSFVQPNGQGGFGNGVTSAVDRSNTSGNVLLTHTNLIANV